MIRTASLCLCAVLLALPAAAETNCDLQRAATFQMLTDDAGGVSVPMTISGHRVNLLIDTGGVDSMLKESAVRSLGLEVRELRGDYVQGFGGYVVDRVARARDVNLGGLAAPFKEFLIMPDHMAPAGIDGTLAPDILRAYDDDFDFANATFSLVSKDHCPGKVVYWTDTGYSEVPFYRDRVGHIQTEVEMDGARFRVIFDTGFSRSIMGLDEARNLFHIPADSPLLKPADAPGFPGAFRYPFRRMTFGGVTLQNPDIILIPERDSRIEGAIIGISVLRQMHIYVAQDEGKMYVTPATAH